MCWNVVVYLCCYCRGSGGVLFIVLFSVLSLCIILCIVM